MPKNSRSPETIPMDELSGRTGTYVLIIKLERACKIVVGSLGAISFNRGHYAYVGSARGPGGLEARLRRHLSRRKKKRWHIDFLFERARPKTALVFLSGIREDSLAALLESFLPSVKGFGASDDPASESHLFYLGGRPTGAVRRILDSACGTPRCRIAVTRLRSLAQRPPGRRST